LVVAVDDLDFGIKIFTFEAKVISRYGTFDQFANRNMEHSGYEYLHYDLLNRPTLVIIILKVKLSYIEKNEHHLQMGMFVKVKNFEIE
jgi:hypothetical protein